MLSPLHHEGNVMPWTKPNDVQDAWIGENVPGDVNKLQKWIDKAEREIKRQVPDIQTRLAAEALIPSTVLLLDAIDVVVAMVTRKFRNPEQLRQTNTTTGPFTDSKTYGGDTPGELEMTDKEIGKLINVKSRGAFTVSMIPITSPFYVAP